MLRINACWPARHEDPEQIAARFRTYLEGLSSIHETLAGWTVGRRKKVPYASVRDDLGSLIAEDIRRDDMGEVERGSGYSISGLSTDKRQYFLTYGAAGGVLPWPQWNRVSLSPFFDAETDSSIFTYPLFKAAMLTLIDAWDPIHCVAWPRESLPIDDEDGWFHKVWMTYIPPADAGTIDLVGIPFSERTPKGGLLLSSTDQMFDSGNPAHVAAATRISKAAQHLNARLPVEESKPRPLPKALQRLLGDDATE